MLAFMTLFGWIGFHYSEKFNVQAVGEHDAANAGEEHDRVGERDVVNAGEEVGEVQNQGKLYKIYKWLEEAMLKMA